MNPLNFLLAAALLAAAVPGLLPAATVHVPGDQPDIQAGIDAAASGDTVLVADGSYSGPGNRNLDYGGKAITVQSENGPAACIIDCQWVGRGFLFQSGEGAASVARGFTIQHGTASYGGAIYCADSAPTIDGNLISQNSATTGGGIYCLRASPLITGNVITLNTASGSNNGGGIFVYTGSTPLIAGNSITSNSAGRYGGGVTCAGVGVHPTITGNLVSGNTALSGGGIYCWSPATITNCEIVSNSAGHGGGIFFDTSPATMTNCLLAGNSADQQGGGAYCSAASAVISNCTVVANSADINGGGVACEEADAAILRSIIWGNTLEQVRVVSGDPPSITYTDIEGLWYGMGNMDADPLFIAGPRGDWYLSQTAAGQPVDSPCVNGGNLPANDVCFAAGSGTVCLGQFTTRTDQVSDQGTADLGYHYDPGDFLTLRAGLTCQPAWGTIPFVTTMTVTLQNLYAGQLRRLAGRIDVRLASGTNYSIWKAGYANVAPGSSMVVAWNQNIPAVAGVLGDNLFTLYAADVTPSPYNQPPYPASGALDTSECTVTGMAP